MKRSMQFEYLPKDNSKRTARRWRRPRYVEMIDKVYKKGLQCVPSTKRGSYRLVKHDRLIFWKGWTNHLPKNGGTYVLLDKTPI